ncbi:MAG TPA: hypothetical protein VNY08_08045 [Bradyrhizobium sp.]|jgi:hypothetical protein|nr:hypothetical protein [Bradyrhizobium sp.]
MAIVRILAASGQEVAGGPRSWAPSDFTPKQLRELHIRLNLPDKA